MDFVSVRAKVIADSTGAVAEIPIILTGNGPLHQLVDYLLWHRHDRSTSWMRKVVQDVGMLLTYMEANAQHFAKPELLFHNFAQRLYSGTVGEDGIDPSGLYWRPHKQRIVSNTLTRLSDFSDWVADRQGTQPLNLLRSASRYDEMVAIAAWEHRRSRAFLGHSWTSVPQGGSLQVRSTHAKRSPKVGLDDDAIAFPEKHFSDLLLNGFVRRSGAGKTDPAKHLNLRDCLITLLMHGAGFRLSECFHLWICDVRPDPVDPTVALVRIHHPSEGEAPDDWLDERGNPIKCNRAAYLAGRYALKPRNELIDHRSAGWKDPCLDGKYYMQAYGLCLVGGNTAPEEKNSKIGGCFNGGELLRSNSKDASNNVYAAVPGGAGNCVRCRWFITEPRYLDSIRAHFNNLSYHLAEDAKVAKGLEEKLGAIKAKRYQAEQANVPFIDQAEFLRVERLWESAVSKTDQIANDLTATFRLIKRCFELIEQSAKDGNGRQQLVAVGGLQDLKMVFEETQSELLQISGICHDAELYPDENPGEAIVRRSQFLDSALYREGVQPVFMTLSKEEQLRLGNRFMDHLAILAQPEDPILGLRRVIGVIESGHSLVELGLQEDISSLLKSELNRPLARASDLTAKPQPLLGASK